VGYLNKDIGPSSKISGISKGGSEVAMQYCPIKLGSNLVAFGAAMSSLREVGETVAGIVGSVDG
jgi:hypothetical protein